MSSHSAQKMFTRLNEAGAKAGLNLPTISSLAVPIPKNLDEQKQVAAMLQEVDYELITLRKFVKNLENIIKIHRIKNGLMQDLLIGEVPVEPLLTA